MFKEVVGTAIRLSLLHLNNILYLWNLQAGQTLLTKDCKDHVPQNPYVEEEVRRP